ncbi:MAG: AAA family ATPase [Propionibacteriaceae bacterium]|jgi:5-methylcytosine-specific restriction protein B|nr:AAA family ATPase [Propionibacteriaceae bacterium]
MNGRAVEAVWIWRFSTAPFKATYGRLPGDGGYTKDYLQVSGSCAELLGRAFPLPEGADRVDFTYCWPGGEARGFIKHPNDRYHLSWGTVAGAPAPWRLIQQPTEDGPQTIPGTPDLKTADEANAEWTRIEKSGVQAFLVAIKLKDEPDKLHIRAYLDVSLNDPVWGFASVDRMLPSLAELARQIPSRGGCASAAYDNLVKPSVAEAIALLEKNPNLLVIGPPGTGKSVLLEDLAKWVANPGILFDPTKNHHDAWDFGERHGKTRTVIMHPSFSYENLVMGLLPVPKNGGVGVEPATGPLINLAHYASTPGRRAMLVLDEFNRGNAAAALGDTLALLDRDKRFTPGDPSSGATIDLAYASLEPNVPTEFSSDTGTRVAAQFSLPNSLWIVAALNTSDRSVAPLDAALRRRFTVLEMQPDYYALRVRLDADPEADFHTDLTELTPRVVGELAARVLAGVNSRIDAVLGIDFRVGPSCFWGLAANDGADMLGQLAEAFDLRLVQNLRMSLIDDDAPLGAILRAGQPGGAGSTSKTHVAWWSSPDVGLGDLGQPRLLLRRVSEMTPQESFNELLRQADIARDGTGQANIDQV